jgi:hypothetical protein
VDTKIHTIDHEKLHRDDFHAVVLEVESPAFSLSMLGGEYRWDACAAGTSIARVPIFKVAPAEPEWVRLLLIQQVVKMMENVPRYSKIKTLHIVTSSKEPIGEWMGLCIVLES